MYIVQSCAVDVDPETWRNIGDELTEDDVRKIGPKRIRAMLTTRRIVEIEVVKPESVFVIESVEHTPELEPKPKPKKKKEG